MSLASQGVQQLQIATGHLTVAFDCTLVALGLSLVIMFLIHLQQREEEILIFDCQQYCSDYLVNRLYEPEPVGGMGPGVFTTPRDHDGQSPTGTTIPERIPR
jgi:hypothetical protein